MAILALATNDAPASHTPLRLCEGASSCLKKGGFDCIALLLLQALDRLPDLFRGSPTDDLTGTTVECDDSHVTD
jgi:hypothetical protein